MSHDLAVIIGCGYLGRCLAHKLLAAYSQVWLTNRAVTNGRDPILESRCCLIAHDFAVVTSTWPALPERETKADLFCLVPPGALATDASRINLMQWVQQLPINRGILTSSTAVYGAGNGAVVSSETPLQLDSERANLLARIEHTWQRDPRFHVLRLAGLYGPGRVIGERALRLGEALPGGADEFLNLFHVDDAADLLLKFIAAPACEAIELGSDGHPVRRGEYYEFLAGCLGTVKPRFGAATGKSSGNRRCDPASTMVRLDWRPTYKNYREGVRAALGPGRK
ncbi:MAG: hypothetical protein EXR86_10710 [Gammaproteobacteria bacterium]|nr:hypothetical protein [Gammaproteobacteria bacterium]